MAARMKSLSFMVLCFITYVTKAQRGNFVVPNCDCVQPENCLDAKPFRCGSNNLICCVLVSSDKNLTVAVSSSTVPSPLPAEEDSLFGTGAAKELKTQCGVATTVYNYVLKEQTDYEYAIENEFPWVLEIFQKEGKLLFPECVAVLTDYRVAVTAAHCVVDLKKEDIVVRAGDYDINQEDERFKHQDSKVLKIIPHPEYNALGAHNNIALLMLEGFKKAPNVNTICTPEPTDFSLKSQCYSAGWGSTDNDEINPEEQKKMKKIQLQLVGGKKCTEKLRKTQLGEEFELSNSSLCAGVDEDESDTGIGFGGAPLFCLVRKAPGSKGHFSLLGITSWRPKGSPNAPGVYTAFPRFLNWTENAIMDFFSEYKSENS